MIPTIRAAKIETLSDNSFKAQYYLSKFKLKVNIMHSVEPEKNLIRFFTDPTRKNLEGRTRVWLSASLLFLLWFQL